MKTPDINNLDTPGLSEILQIVIDLTEVVTSHEHRISDQSRQILALEETLSSIAKDVKSRHGDDYALAMKIRSLQGDIRHLSLVR
ncbi:hypothetical protein C6380_14345 [Pseudomonas syringae pv. actinidiae]|uniref:hypothetical protein n=1 Tax=Pseudomonas syringae TaxID=317 RepID=UPI000BB5813E|nr:hypothetical protein [Pseudomonas syringae]PBK49580.1 hypothetical protein BUE61_22570 [Pseudomonas syringae pv. actinidiae]PBK54240.1 hypothetical protein BUE60_10375 [Pseudomonas syringae pv. actinidiae]RJX53476.1 hypothetical protein C6379_17490 [Pseudomonas syringae pv. actinidiae]RJX55594.1 hypothetical protein C6380_14345 [Pseudomonas syringae pv. actinidiae]RJX63848.1 hypothetical protein C6383_05040 [Pseudomonas syringae pv. actinidiae]